jgi:DNA processing protein
VGREPTNADAPTWSDRLARVALSCACEPGDLTATSLVDQLGAEGALLAQQAPKPGSELHSRLLTVEPERELERAAQKGVRFVVPGDEEWPAPLDELGLIGDRETGQGGTPIGLWVKGPMPLTELTTGVAIVGARSCTTYGTEVAHEIAASVARDGRVVVSGAAIGIDTAAHRGAVAASGRTAAVLACGPERVYPEASRRLLQHLWAEGVVVSEAPPGSAPTRLRFLSRNRLIAALTCGTVVVEAAIRSGALSTARWAEALSRSLMCVPGPVTSAASVGVHQLLRDGAGTLVTRGAEVLEAVGGHGEHLLPPPREESRPRDRLSVVEQRVLEAVPLVEPARVDSIAHVAALHVRDCDPALRRLARGGFVTCTPRGWRQAFPSP